jgi:hypothetical protein
MDCVRLLGLAKEPRLASIVAFVALSGCTLFSEPDRFAQPVVLTVPSSLHPQDTLTVVFQVRTSPCDHVTETQRFFFRDVVRIAVRIRGSLDCDTEAIVTTYTMRIPPRGATNFTVVLQGGGDTTLVRTVFWNDRGIGARPAK